LKFIKSLIKGVATLVNFGHLVAVNLDDQLASFHALSLLVGWVMWPVKTIPEMTYNVS